MSRGENPLVLWKSDWLRDAVVYRANPAPATTRKQAGCKNMMSKTRKRYPRGAQVKLKIVVAIAALIVFIGANAADPVGPKLTPRLKILLADEMQQVAEATSDLALAIAAGDHATVNRLASAVRDSFILKQSLTEQDKKDLMSAVPAGFIALDRSFHGLAGKLAGQADKQDTELQNYYFSRMLETCTACHAQFATDRFPGLATE